MCSYPSFCNNTPLNLITYYNLLQFYQDTLETNEEMEGDDMKANEKKTDKDAVELFGKSEEGEQKCKYIC
jgi:hypothetical protein